MREFIIETCKVAFLLTFTASWICNLLVTQHLTITLHFTHNPIILFVETAILVIGTVGSLYRCWNLIRNP